MNLTEDELYIKIKAWLAAGHTGDIVLHANSGRIESFDFKEHGRVVGAPKPHQYVAAVRL